MLISNFKDYQMIAGCDEAGRGCLAGPVVAAAVILPVNYTINGLNDSKQLNKNQRNKMKELILNAAIDYSIASVDNTQIDNINILNASILAMHLALDNLKTHPDIILVDGNRFHKYKTINHECIVKGDGKYSCIAAASVLAKTYRDDYMDKISEEYPKYFWSKNKGYPTLQHSKAILEYGFSPYHRKTFNVPSQTKLF